MPNSRMIALLWPLDIGQTYESFLPAAHMKTADVTLRQMEAFVAVAEAGGFRAAANVMFVTQSVLSKTIAALERSVGGVLFERESRQLRLTALGCELLIIARRTLAAHKNGMWEVERFVEGKRGSVRIATLPSVAATLLPEAISRYLAQRPDVAVRMLETLASGVRENLVERNADIGVTWDNPSTLEGFRTQAILIDQIVAIVSDRHPFAQHETVTWEQVATQPLICLDQEASSRRLADRAFEELGLIAKPRIEVKTASTVGALVAGGLGIATMSGLVRGIMGPNVVAVPIVSPVVTRTLCVAWDEYEINPAAEAFVMRLTTLSGSGVKLPDYVDWAPRARGN